MKKTIAFVSVAVAGATVGLVFLVSALVGPSSAEAKANFCNSLSSLSSTVMSYQGLNPETATNDEFDAAAEDITNAWDNVVDDANDWANAYDNPLTLAYDDLYWAIQALPEDNTTAEDIDALQPELSAFPQAYQETFDGSGCSTA